MLAHTAVPRQKSIKEEPPWDATETAKFITAL